MSEFNNESELSVDTHKHIFLSELTRIVKKNISTLSQEIVDLLQRCLAGINAPTPFPDDVILPQERFEPPEWALPITNQLENLATVFPAIRIDTEYIAKREAQAPPENTKRVVIPKLSFLAKENGLKSPYEDIGVLIEQTCEEINIQRNGNFTHYRKGQLGQDRIKCVPDIAKKRLEIEENVPGDILILDVDMGNIYAGWTPRRARENSILHKEQLALSSVDVGWILILNPNRLQKNTDLSIDTVMEEYLSLDRGWVTVLFFYHRGGKLEFGYRWNRRQYFDSGAAIAIMKKY